MLSALLLAALLVSVTLGYSRHAVMAADAVAGNLQAAALDKAVGSGLSWARQSLVAGAGGGGSLVTPDGQALTINVRDVDGQTGLRNIEISAVHKSQSQYRQAIVEVHVVEGDVLPKLTASARMDVNNHPSLIDVTSDTTYTDAELSGIVLIRRGVTLTLDDVIVRGTIVSEPALSDAAVVDADRTALVIIDGLLVEPSSTLAGCAIVAPDASVNGLAGSRVQLHGVVVCETLALTGSGAVHGQIATTEPLVLSTSIDQPGAGRTPRAWPVALESGAQDIGRIVFPVNMPTSGEANAIADFAFPAARSPGSLAPDSGDEDSGDEVSLDTGDER